MSGKFFSVSVLRGFQVGKELCPECLKTFEVGACANCLIEGGGSRERRVVEALHKSLDDFLLIYKIFSLIYLVKGADDKEGRACFGVELALRVEDFTFADHCFAPVVQDLCLREDARRVRHDRVHELHV